MPKRHSAVDHSAEGLQSSRAWARRPAPPDFLFYSPARYARRAKELTEPGCQRPPTPTPTIVGFARSASQASGGRILVHPEQPVYRHRDWRPRASARPGRSAARRSRWPAPAHPRAFDPRRGGAREPSGPGGRRRRRQGGRRHRLVPDWPASPD